MRDERGAMLLVTAVGAALVASITAYAVLVMALSTARRGAPLQRTKALSWAEVGLVIAKEQLWADPQWPNNPPLCQFTVPSRDVNGDGAPDPVIVITLSLPGGGSACGPGTENTPKQITSQVVFQ